jgi:redox-sensitive bicupin YhaK (pirin superfamily)
VIPQAGPAKILLGNHNGAASAIVAPSPINYLAVTLKAGQRWRYQPPAGHTVLWVAVGKGTVSSSDQLQHGELVAFEPSNAAVDFLATSDAEFVLGSAVPHDHDLVLGYYSVHTSQETLQKGEAQIEVIRRRLVEAGRL